jgi:hypothetical protein
VVVRVENVTGNFWGWKGEYLVQENNGSLRHFLLFFVRLFLLFRPSPWFLVAMFIFSQHFLFGAQFRRQFFHG